MPGRTATSRGRRPAQQAYPLKITLGGIRPQIWRQFLVPGSIRLDELHDVAQCVMGWRDSHLRMFRTREAMWAPSFPLDDELGARHETRCGLRHVLRHLGDWMLYVSHLSVGGSLATPLTDDEGCCRSTSAS